jgi:hypothetical protein
MCALNDSLEPEEYYDCLLRFTSDYLKERGKDAGGNLEIPESGS